MLFTKRTHLNQRRRLSRRRHALWLLAYFQSALQLLDHFSILHVPSRILKMFLCRDWFFALLIFQRTINQDVQNVLRICEGTVMTTSGGRLNYSAQLE